MTKGSSSDSKLLPTGGLTSHSIFSTPFSFSLHLPLSVSQGPHIASVTLAAYECGSVDFPEPPYPDQVVCPQQNAPAAGSDAEQVGVEASVESAAIQGTVSLWTIVSKVRLEACMWVSACYTLFCFLKPNLCTF